MKRFLSLVPLVLMLGGCANWSARYPNTPDSPDQSIIVKDDSPDNIRIAMVEFSEFGSYQDPTQIERAEKLIRKQRRPLVVTYIHGWHNSADSQDVVRFKDFLTRLAKSKAVTDHGLKVVGVYIAWNGESWKTPILNTFTIWDRKAAAERLASNGDCLDALLRVGRAARQTNPQGHYNFFLGHSLGGLVLERTIAHTLLTARHSGSGELPWDLALMLNPAADAVLTRQLMASLDARYEYQNGKFVPRDGGQSIYEDRPTIVAITADNDRATGNVFPISAAVAEVGDTRWPKVQLPPGADGSKEKRVVSEQELHRRTPGHSPYLVNYVIKEKSGTTLPPFVKTSPGNSAFDANLAQDIHDRTFFTSAPQDYPSEKDRIARSQDKQESTGPQWRAWQIQRVTGKADGGKAWNGPLVPYWDIRVDKHIIDDHGGIWSDNSMAMMAAIFRMHVPVRLGAAPSHSAGPQASKPMPAVQSQRLLGQ